MAVKGNDSTQVTGIGKKTLYSGIVDCKVLAVNPTKEELNSIGVKTEKDQNYIFEKDGNKSAFINIWVQAQTTEPQNPISNIAFFIDSRINKSEQKGTTQFINKYGKTAWGKDAESIASEYFLKDGVRESHRGEEDLHKFLAAYLNTVYNTKENKYDECIIDNPQAFFNGDFSELKQIFNTFKDNTVRCLWGVDEKGYQVVYNKYFEKTWSNANYKMWNQMLNNEFSQFKADLMNGEYSPFQVYTKEVGQQSSTPTPDKENTKEVF